MANHSTYGKPNEVQTFDYIYGVLYCPDYRAKYADFLKSDFPKIPFPKSPEEFWEVSQKGTCLRKLHLMDKDIIGDTPFPFTGVGDRKILKYRFENCKVWINESQYFNEVPNVAWEFHIGGYQPAQKWLKDRKGQILSVDEVTHYQKIIKVLLETDRIMKTIAMEL